MHTLHTVNSMRCVFPFKFSLVLLASNDLFYGNEHELTHRNWLLRNVWENHNIFFFFLIHTKPTMWPTYSFWFTLLLRKYLDANYTYASSYDKCQWIQCKLLRVMLASFICKFSTIQMSDTSLTPITYEKSLSSCSTCCRIQKKKKYEKNTQKFSNRRRQRSTLKTGSCFTFKCRWNLIVNMREARPNHR